MIAKIYFLSFLITKTGFVYCCNNIFTFNSKLIREIVSIYVQAFPNGIFTIYFDNEAVFTGPSQYCP